MATQTSHSHEQTLQHEFSQLVNMSASELKQWLTTDKSKSVGQKKNGANESTGHQSGRQIMEILEKDGKDLSEADIHEMKRVVSYIKRHLAQRPEEIADSNWAYSLKNWGHDPTRK
jgi:DNA topoisomerase VI subunit B